MMDKIALVRLVIALLSSFCCSSSAARIESDAAISLYTHVCGTGKVCNIHDTNLSAMERPAILDCPVCHCDSQCLTRGDCCPDIWLNTCVDVMVLVASSSPLAKTSFYVVNTCPHSTDNETAKKCHKDKMMTKDSLSINTPVTSRVTEKHYRNEFCAMCNNDTDWVQWGIKVDECEDETFDVNLYSSIEALSDGVEKHQCNLGFDGDSLGASSCSIKSQINQCNVTGLWDKYNSEIENACLGQYNLYGLFRNMFCYICNTGFNLYTPVITSCENNSEPLLEWYCETSPVDPRAFPYKNSYCQKCNDIPMFRSIILNKRRHVYNASADIPYEASISIQRGLSTVCGIAESTTYNILRYSPTIIYLCAIKLSVDEQQRMNRVKTEIEYLNQSIEKKRKGKQRNVNFRALYYKYRQRRGRSSWCSVGTNSRRICSCEEKCFSNHDCCPDADPPVECRSIAGNRTSVIVRCTNGNDSIIRYLCEREENDTIFDSTPVYGTDYKEFKNIFCLMCSEEAAYLKTYLQTAIYRDIHVRCDKYVDIENFLPSSRTFMILSEICETKFFHYYSTRDLKVELDFCDIRDYTESENTTTFCESDISNEVTRDMKYLCEDMGHYIYSTCKTRFTNIFCEMCSFDLCDNDQCQSSFNYDQSAYDCFISVEYVTQYVNMYVCDKCFNYRSIFSIHELIVAYVGNGETDCEGHGFFDKITVSNFICQQACSFKVVAKKVLLATLI